MAGKRGRPPKWYTTPDGTVYEGLSHRTDGRWLINATRRYLHRGTSPEDAVKIFKSVMAGNPVPVRVKHKRFTGDDLAAAVAKAKRKMVRIDSEEFWEHARGIMIMTPERVEQMIGISGLADCVNRWVYRKK